MEPLPRLLTPEQAAKETGLKKRQLLAYAKEDIVPCVRIGRLVRFERDALRAWIKAGGKSYAGGWRRECES